MALSPAAIGVYGVLSYLANQRFRKMAIRFALGAERGDLFGLVARQGLLLVGTGLVIGVALAPGLNRFMKAHFWLYDVKPTDPTTYAAAGVILLSIALLACSIRARQAANVDRVTVLRHEYSHRDSTRA